MPGKTEPCGTDHLRLNTKNRTKVLNRREGLPEVHTWHHSDTNIHSWGKKRKKKTIPSGAKMSYDPTVMIQS